MAVGLILGIAISYAYPSHNSTKVGAIPTPTTETSMYINDPTQVLGSQGLAVGTNGTTIHTVLAGVCTVFSMPTTTINASSSLTFGCAVPNLLSSTVLNGQNTTEAQFGANTNGLFITGASASSTQGWLTITVYNPTGTATSSYPNATSTIDYQVSF